MLYGCRRCWQDTVLCIKRSDWWLSGCMFWQYHQLPSQCSWMSAVHQRLCFMLQLCTDGDRCSYITRWLFAL